jgi:STE24 endopeptidase
VAWVLLVVSVAALVLLALVLVPWSWAPGLRLHVPRADAVLAPDELRAAESHAKAMRQLTWTSYALSILLAALLGFTRLGSTLVRRASGRLRWWLAVPWGTLLIVLLSRLLTLPFGLLVRRRNLEDGLTDQGLLDWFRDWALSSLLSWLLMAALLLLVVGLARRAARLWFVWCAVAVAALTFALSLVYPLLVEPLFNDFRSLPDGPLKEQVLELADTEGVQVQDVLVSDASRRTTTLNAYVSGLGSTRRIVVYDNLLRDVPPRQVLSVVAHELGHARHQDVLLGTGLGALGSTAGIAVLALLLDTAWLRRRAAVSGPADPGAVALILALVTLGVLVSTPAQNVVSRAIEARADLTALQATHDPDAFRGVQRNLARHSLADPTPPWIGYVMFASHPTVLQRIALADAVERSER